MYLVLLKINKKIYFESLDNQDEMMDFIEGIENKFGEIEYSKSVIINGSKSDINEIVEMIEEHYYLHIVGRKIDEKVYKDLIQLIGSLSLDVNITYGIEFEESEEVVEEVEEETEESFDVMEIIKSDEPIPSGVEFNLDTISDIVNDVEDESSFEDIPDTAYTVYVNWGNEYLTVSLEPMEGKFDTSKSFTQTFSNLDEAISLFEGFKQDFMEIISDETETMFMVDEYLEEVKDFIEQKISMMSWKETQAIKYLNGRYMQKKVEPTEDYTVFEYLTAKEVMKKLRISDQTLANWRRNNLIDFRRISNRKYLYLIDSVNEIFENGVDTSGVGNTVEASIVVEKQTKQINYEEEILKLLKPLAFKIPEYKYKQQNFFLNFGNINLSSSPQVMINNRFQLIDFIKKTVICDNPKELYKYLVEVFESGKEPRVDTSKKIQQDFSKFYLNKLFDKSMVS